VITKVKLAASSIIVGGAALVGATAGWDVGPVTIELASDQLAILGGASAAILAAVGCTFALERAEARARFRAHQLWLESRRSQLGAKAQSILNAMLALAQARREHHAPGGASFAVAATRTDALLREVGTESEGGESFEVGATRTE